jgi:hypothetical protein
MRYLRSLAVIALALLLVGCKYEEGETLNVDILAGTLSAPTLTNFGLTAVVNYKGSKTLGYSWSQVNSGGDVGFSPAVSTGGGTNPGTTVKFFAPGTYVLRLDVYEIGGDISDSDQVTFLVTGPAG